MDTNITTRSDEHLEECDSGFLKSPYPQQAFFKEFKMVGQICREGKNESAILPKARYTVTVFYCLGSAISPPVGPRQSPGESPGGEPSGSSSDPAVHSTKKCLQKLLSWYIFLCVLHTNSKETFI